MAALLLVLAVVLPAAPALASSGHLLTVVGTGTADFNGDGKSAAEATLHHPAGLALDASARLLIADTGNHIARRVDSDGTVVTIAGTAGSAGHAGDGGPATSALLNGPRAVALRPNGIAFVADTGNHVIRDIDRDGVITTIAGTGTPGFAGDDGPAAAAQLAAPSGIASRPNGMLYIADTGNHRIRMIDTLRVITTVAGSDHAGFSGDGGPATAAALDGPQGIGVEPGGTLYIADTGNHRIRKVDTLGVITTVAGVGTPGFDGDGGPATEAQLDSPTAVAVAVDGSLLVADTGNHAVRRIAPDGVITTVAGTGQPGFSPDGTPGISAQLLDPSAVAFTPDGAVLLSDTGNNRVRQVSTVVEEDPEPEPTPTPHPGPTPDPGPTFSPRPTEKPGAGPRPEGTPAPAPGAGHGPIGGGPDAGAPGTVRPDGRPTGPTTEVAVLAQSSNDLGTPVDDSEPAPERPDLPTYALVTVPAGNRLHSALLAGTARAGGQSARDPRGLLSDTGVAANRSVLRRGIEALVSSARAVSDFVGSHPDAAIHGSAIVSALAFLAVQRQIDRRDPKLALAPIVDDPELLFRTPPPPLDLH